MSTATAGLAEVYVMRKLHKEKIKKMGKLQTAVAGEDTKKTKKYSGGWFSGAFKKVHPGTGTTPAATAYS